MIFTNVYGSIVIYKLHDCMFGKSRYTCDSSINFFKILSLNGENGVIPIIAILF